MGHGGSGFEHGLLPRVVFYATGEKSLAKLEELAHVMTCTLWLAGPLLTLTGLRRMRESLMQGCASQSGKFTPSRPERRPVRNHRNSIELARLMW